MRQQTTQLTIETSGQGLFDFTRSAARFVDDSGVSEGLLTLFVQHTSASLIIQENADPDVQKDLLAYFACLVPEGDQYIHDAEGPDDMPAHIRSVLTQVSLGVPVTGGRMALGTWQGLYLFEHRRHAHRRRVLCHLVGG